MSCSELYAQQWQNCGLSVQKVKSEIFEYLDKCRCIWVGCANLRCNNEVPCRVLFVTTQLPTAFCRSTLGKTSSFSSQPNQVSCWSQHLSYRKPTALDFQTPGHMHWYRYLRSEYRLHSALATWQWGELFLLIKTKTCRQRYHQHCGAESASFKELANQEAPELAIYWSTC